MKQQPDYKYNALLNYIYDGDTINVDIDLGFGIWIKDQNIRLFGINTPEIKGESRVNGLMAKGRLKSLLQNKPIVIETIKDRKEKYGRWLGNIYVEDVLINTVLVAEGLAVVYNG